jgi:hypothetical protein
MLSGCHSYRVVQIAAAPEGGVVRVGLTENGSRDLAWLIGENISLIEGALAGRSDTTVALDVTGVMHPGLAGVAWGGERVEIPRRYIAQVEERQLDRTRSVLAAGSVAVVTLLARALFSGGDRNVTTGVPGTGGGK